MKNPMMELMLLSALIALKLNLVKTIKSINKTKDY